MEKTILDLLKKIKERNDILRLFREILGFRPPASPTPSFEVLQEFTKNIEIIAQTDSVEVYYIILSFTFDGSFAEERKIRKAERQIIIKIPNVIKRKSIFVFSDQLGVYWDFVYATKYGPRLLLKRFTIRPDNREKLRTPATQLAHLLVKKDKGVKKSPQLEEIFSVEAISNYFFTDYKEVFDHIKKALLRQSNDIERVHRFVHHLLNRLMFLYFVQRRGVFNKDKNFLSTFWNTYRNNREGKNEFYEKWLKILFFESLNGKFHPKEYFKIAKTLNFNDTLQLAPHLNGGLFKEDDDIDALDVKLNDDLFISIFDFLESYNFTVRENTPLDEDLEIDPEMLGYVYEMMVNVSESDDEQHKSGIFYTQRTEIDFMLRRSLVEFLFNKTRIDKFKLYQFIFTEIDEQKIPQFNNGEAQKIYDVLDEITIVDPACGSGHYLVVAVQIIFNLKKELWHQLGNSEATFKVFDQKLKIIQESIFGVDVKKWATEIAKLRLWLDLIVEAKDEQFSLSGEALLPNLSFKIRVGDSLVQKIGTTYFKVREISGVPPTLQALKNQLIDTKKNYFYGAKGTTEPSIKSKEIQFFKALIEEKINANKTEIQRLEAPLKEKYKEQLQLIKSGQKAKQLKFELSKKDQERVDFLKKENERLQEEKNNLTLKSEHTFWPIEFAEIFSGQDGEGGFGIVIANPPYVRQELIDDPIKGNGKETKKEYKEELLEQTKKDWEDEKGSLIKINKKADLYVYFYLKGLQLLNPDGVMCFISSNSWLDVEFGAGLQELLLKRVPILGIYDNQARRSFKHADVNTIIAIFKAPRTKDWQDEAKNNKVKFIMFKKPFEEVLFTEILWEIEKEQKERVSNDNFRLNQKTQYDLYSEGLEETESAKKATLSKEIAGNYTGNKWGGIYLRAPDIYFKILERGKGKLVRLGDIADVRFGIKTGANEFFYLEEEAQKKWGIEKEFLKPVIKGPRECKSIFINPKDLKYKVFMCHKSKEELKGTKALKYIEWGEKNKFNKIPSVQSRNRWWDITEPEISDYLWIMTYRERFFVLVNGNTFADARFYDIYSKTKDKINLGLILNSTFTLFYIELMSRTYGGGGGPVDVKVYEVEMMIILNPSLLKGLSKSNSILNREVNTIFKELGVDGSKTIREQDPKPLPDRAELDKIVFDELGLTDEERKEVYWAVCELVKNRLDKAKNV